MDRLGDLRKKYGQQSTAAPAAAPGDVTIELEATVQNERRGRKGGNAELTAVTLGSSSSGGGGAGGGLGPKNELEDFFKQVGLIQSGIKEIAATTEQIKAKHNEALLNTDVERGKAITAELDRLMSLVTSKSGEVKQGLKWMDEQTKAIPPKEKPAEVRIRQNQHQQLTQQFLGAMRAYQDASEAYSQKYKDQVKRRIKTRYTAKDGKPLTDDEVDRFATQLLVEGKEDAIFQQSLQTLQQVQENHRDILMIEASMRELHQIFADMAVLVEEQGELMDDILTNVSKSVDYVSRGREELHQAKVYAKKSRKLMCCVIVILIIVAIVILIPTLLTTSSIFKH